MKEKYFIYLQKKSCTRQFESKLSLRSFAFSLQKKRRRKKKNMKQENNRIQLPLEEIKLAFAASCVEGAARKLVAYILKYTKE